MVGLRTRFGQLEEETRLSVMTEMLSFARRPNESINAVLSRYELVRGRARNEGMFVMTVPGCALQLLKALNIDGQQLIPLLQPFNYSLPATEEEFVRLQDTIRRIGHVMENTLNNIGQALRHGNQPARQGEYFSGSSDQPVQTFLNMGDSQPLSSSPLPNPSTPHPGYPEANLAATWQFNPSWQSGSNVWQGTALPLQQQQAYASPTNQHVFWANDGETYEEDVEDAWESSTDTDTSSDSGKEEVDMSEFEHLSNEAASQKAFLGYRIAKRKW